MTTTNKLPEKLGISNKTLTLFLNEKHPKCREKGSLLFTEDDITKIQLELRTFFEKHPELDEEAVVWFWTAMKQGEASVKNELEKTVPASLMRILGDCLWHGEHGISGNQKEAVVWYWKAANRGDPGAKNKLSTRTAVQYLIGNCFFEGNGVVANQEEAVEWYLKAAKRGNRDAMRILGDCYFYGTGVLMNEEEAKHWYHKAANLGDVEAERILSGCFEGGVLAQRDAETIVQTWKAANQGDKSAKEKLDRAPHASLCFLGDCLWDGDKGIPQNKKEAAVWYWKAAEHKLAKARLRKREVKHLIAGCFWDGSEGLTKDRKKAVIWHWEAMRLGDEASKEFLTHKTPLSFQRFLADCLWCGTEVVQNPKAAIDWYRTAAENGDTKAMRSLGECLWKPSGFQNKKEAVVNYWKAAERRDKIAKAKLEESEVQRILGNCFFEGNGVAANQEEAVEWYLKAANQGDVEAMSKLGNCYLHGEGVTKSKKEAKYWHEKVTGSIAPRRFYDNDSAEYACYFSGYDVGTI